MEAVILILALLLFVGAGYGVIRLVRRVASRLDAPADSAHGGEVLEPNRAGIAVSLAGALLLIVAVFLPHVESSTFLRVEDNTLIEGGDGWIFVVIAVLVVGAVYRYSQRPVRTNGVWLLGLIAIGFAIFEGTGSRVTLHSAVSLAGEAQTEHASPAAGVYAAGVGGLLLLIAGLWFAGKTVAGIGPPTSSHTKRCPDCAEAVLVDARVCKHCGYRFDSTEPAPPVINR